jgi:hypothetical protein
MMTALRQYKFRAVVTFPAAGRTFGQRRIAGRRTRCVIQPGERIYLPAVIWGLKSSQRGQAMSAVLSLALADGEADDYFGAGQSFTIWSDVLVGDSIHGEGLVGHGAVCTRESPSPAGREPGSREDSSAERGRRRSK